jgi:hypothetical protein
VIAHRSEIVTNSKSSSGGGRGEWPVTPPIKSDTIKVMRVLYVCIVLTIPSPPPPSSHTQSEALSAFVTAPITPAHLNGTSNGLVTPQYTPGMFLSQQQTPVGESRASSQPAPTTQHTSDSSRTKQSKVSMSALHVSLFDAKSERKAADKREKQVRIVITIFLFADLNVECRKRNLDERLKRNSQKDWYGVGLLRGRHSCVRAA